jgi:hypothetical protein
MQSNIAFKQHLNGAPEHKRVFEDDGTLTASCDFNFDEVYANLDGEEPERRKVS